MGYGKLRSFAWVSTSVLAVALVGGCSGGGSTTTPPPPPPPPANSAPAFTSAATASVAEDTAAGTTVYTAAATDADGDPLTYTIAGGADAARFQLTAAGALSFVAVPDFENPADADQNNVYLVEIRVSDGKTSTVLPLSVSVTDDPRVRFTFVTGGLIFPSDFIYVGQSLYYVEQFGTIGTFQFINGNQPNRTRFHQTSRISQASGEGGLLSFAFLPNPPAATPNLFFEYVVNEQGDLEVRRYAQACPPNLCSNGNFEVVLRIPHPVFTNNYGGFLQFGPDGMLYIGTGDGGGSFDPNGNAQNTNSLLGKILRIDPRTDAFPDDPLRNYSIPAGNPFAGGGGRPEIWALGLRNPVRGGFDAATGNLYIGDRGEPGRPQEINLLRPGEAGLNFGWPFREGTQVRVPGGPAAVMNPVIEYLGQGATGGNVYRSTNPGENRSFLNHYFFGDLDGRMFSVPVSLLVQGTTVASGSIVARTDPESSGPGSVRGIALRDSVYIANGTSGLTMFAR